MSRPLLNGPLRIRTCLIYILASHYLTNFLNNVFARLKRSLISYNLHLFIYIFQILICNTYSFNFSCRKAFVFKFSMNAIFSYLNVVFNKLLELKSQEENK